jgi:hypothetical protein
MHQRWRATTEEDRFYNRPRGTLQLRDVLQLARDPSGPRSFIDLRADMRIEIAVGAFGRAVWPMHIDAERFTVH